MAAHHVLSPAALLLRLCVVGLLAAAPALSSLTSRAAAVGSRSDRPDPGLWLRMRSLQQVRAPHASSCYQLLAPRCTGRGTAWHVSCIQLVFC